MSEEALAPGKRLRRALIHPQTGQTMLPAGAVLNEAYIERIERQGLRAQLIECLERPAEEEGEAIEGEEVKDLDAFDIEIPALPDFITSGQFVPVKPAPQEPHHGHHQAHGHASHSHHAAAHQGHHAEPSAAAPKPSLPPPLPMAPAPPRYRHNAVHALPERTVLSAMMVAVGIEDQMRAGAFPGYQDIGRVVDEVIERLGSSLDKLSTGMELRVVNQSHERSHPVNVMILSVAMGLALNFRPDALKNLAVAALVHDIGKAAIPLEVLNKVGALSPYEVDLLRAHPLMGKRMVEKMPWSNPTISNVVYQHHERNDGSGYPQRLTDRQIMEEAKIVAIAEVYDALISDTAYRKRFTPEVGYNSIRAGERTGLDPRMIRAFQRFIVPYPVNAQVMLDSGEVAVVVQVNRQNIFRPTVRIGGELLDLERFPQKSIANSHFA